ncbi:hypothetical protein PGQ11_002582 [Apiospora arundinis]|uniref:Uncharacterized protein n=1 Tax=Apiospora arundinis TaxID=335852 RepID=A0ABR2JIJ5_9PEZI
MAAETSTPPLTDDGLVPEKIVFACLHERKVSELPPYVREAYECLVLWRLIEKPGKVDYLQKYCYYCVSDAEKVTERANAQEGGDPYQAITKPLKEYGFSCKDRVSLLLMFCEIMHTNKRNDLRPHLLDRDDPLVQNCLDAYRSWSLVITLHMESDVHERFLSVIRDMFGGLVWDEITKLVERCRLHIPQTPESFDQFWPASEDRSGGLFFLQIDSFSDRAQDKDLVFPADFEPDFKHIYLAANSWTAQLLGPPQRRDMSGTDISPEAVKRQAYIAGREYDIAVARRKGLNAETMRLKIQLYELHQRAAELRNLRDSDHLDGFLDLVKALEKRGQFIVFLQTKYHESWDVWVQYAKQFENIL